MNIPMSRIHSYIPRLSRSVPLAIRNLIGAQIHKDVIARLDYAYHSQTCANCEDGYCYDCILLEMTDPEYLVDTILLNIQRLECVVAG